MELYLPWAAADAAWLQRWAGRASSGAGPAPAGVYHDSHRRIVAVEPPGPPLPGGPFEAVATRIMRYDVFPPAMGERVVAREPLQLGDAVGLYYRFPGSFLRMFFASRVTEIVEEPFRRGFAYQTLAGHPEQGEELFYVEKDERSGAVVFGLRAWSRPSRALVRLFAPLARMLQWQAGKSALDYTEKAIMELYPPVRHFPQGRPINSTFTAAQ